MDTFNINTITHQQINYRYIQESKRGILDQNKVFLSNLKGFHNEHG